MQFSYTDEQQLLRDSAAAFVRDHSSLQRIRKLRDSNDADGFSRELWRDIAALGWLGMTDEHDIGFYLKRARTAELTFGDAAFHRNRFATLQAY